MKILIGLSGGVDSAVSALLLKQAGYELIAVTMTLWDYKANPDIKVNPSKNACYGPEEIHDINEARKIAEQLDIPYHLIDCSKKYKDIVLKNFSSEYLAGRTPNPCIWCNSLIKFGTLPFLAEKSGISFDKFATGHYASVVYSDISKRYLLKTARDTKKDQSYFLYRLKQEQLAKLVFPLENLTKQEVRNIAKANNLLVYDKKESQDFYSGAYSELINTSDIKGNIVDIDGNILGMHNGVWNYTIGQRKGLNISKENPMYVIEIKNNDIVVGTQELTYSSSLIAKDINLISIKELKGPITVKAKIRSTASPAEAIISKINDDEVELNFTNSVRSVSPGQSVVFYDDDIVLGGGIIK